MLHKDLMIRRVAVLGAGVMGAQIAAHFANARIQPYLFDLPSKEGDRNGLVNKAIASLKTLHPSPLAEESLAKNIIPANYEDDLEKLKDCELVIEAISERMDWKTDLYKKVVPHLKEGTIFATNTSGLSIQKLAEALPTEKRSHFFGCHFFNPPRYMELVELIPHKETNLVELERFEAFLVFKLGKGVVYAKDTPNFIANRIGMFSFLSTLYHAEKFHLSPDIVDLMTGPLLGRAKSATFRTLDIVGLDTFAHVVNTMITELKKDPWSQIFVLPNWIQSLIRQGALGQKTKAGVYRKQNSTIEVIDLKQGQYRPAEKKLPDELLTILKIEDPKERFSKLMESPLPEAQFLWAIHRDLFHYCAYHLEKIAETTRDIDLAIRLGYAWNRGPFENWQMAGWKFITDKIEADIQAKKTLSNAPLPAWVKNLEKGPYGENKAYSPEHHNFLTRSQLPVYKRQLYKDDVLGETEDEGQTEFENEAVRMWHMNDEVAILSFKTKKNTINDKVLDGVLEAVARAEKDFKGLVLWQKGDKDFSYGANLKEVLEVIHAGKIEDIAKTCAQFQQAALALRYSQVPTIAATRGLVLGGACELMMHTTRTVAALETYCGLVEVGVGIIPAGAGSKEMALRATLEARGEDPFCDLQNYFKTIAMATVAKSAKDAKRLGFLRPWDIVVMNPHEILYVAKQQVLGLCDSNYQPPIKRLVKVAGKSGIATLQVALVNMREGGFISDHDYKIGCGLAKVMCGGEVEGGLEVPEEWILELEQQVFMDLLRTDKTQARMAFMLENGKPLRN